MAYQVIPIRSLPGIKRDGTDFEGDNYTDGRWMRFQRGLPRKMGGFRAVTSDLQEKIYGMGSFSANQNQYLHLGGQTRLDQAVVGNNGILSSLNNRTPAGLVGSANNLWQFENFANSVAGLTSIIAHAAPNLNDIASTTETNVFYDDATGAGPLANTSPIGPVSGGIVALGPFLFAFGNAGFVNWSAPNDPATATAVSLSRVCGQKIVRGLKLRGGGSGPAGIFWSLDEIVRAQFNPDPTVEFSFDTLASELALLASRSIIEYDGVFYWWNVDRPLMFNGVVREVPNNLNLNYFLDGLNFEQRQKIYAYKVPRFGEIWWAYPRGNATECTHAVVLNVREQTWYDTPLPDSGRSSGVFAQVYPKPFMVDVDLTATGYTLWQHETGVDKINGSSVEPVPSEFTTANISTLTADQPLDKSLSLSILEPDFVQTGDMTVQVLGKANARAPSAASEEKTFPEDNGALTAADQIVRFKEARRELQLRFVSNTPNGDYQMGLPLLHVTPDDGRVTQ